MVSTDTGLTDYLSTVLEQMSGMLLYMPKQKTTTKLLTSKISSRHQLSYCCADWLVRGELQKMVLVITSSETKETLERWTFDLQTDKSVVDGG